MTTNAIAPGAIPALKFRQGFDLARADAIRTAYQRTVAGDAPLARNATVYGARAIAVDGIDALEFIGVTEPVARDGDIVRVDGIDLAGFSKNNVWLWSHDYHGARPPIGTVISTNRESDPVLGRIFTYRVIPVSADDVDHEHLEFTRMIFSFYRQRKMAANSYGWKMKEARPITDGQGYVIGLEHVTSEALEWSACNVGADRNSVLRMIQSGDIPERQVKRFMGQEFTSTPAYELRELPPPNYEWRDGGTPESPAPAAVVVAEPPVTDPPPVMELRLTGGDALGETLLAQLRAELPALLGELGLQGRKGAAISKKNRDKLQAAQGHLDQCATHAENLRASAQACMDMIGEVLGAAQMPDADEEMTHAVPTDDASTRAVAERIDDLTRTAADVQARPILTRIDDLTHALGTRAETHAAQRNFDDVLAEIIGARATGTATSPDSATR